MYHSETENEEEEGGGGGGIASGKEGREDGAEERGQEGHDGESEEGTGEDGESRMPHGENRRAECSGMMSVVCGADSRLASSHEEGLVADFRNDNYR